MNRGRSHTVYTARPAGASDDSEGSSDEDYFYYNKASLPKKGSKYIAVKPSNVSPANGETAESSGPVKVDENWETDDDDNQKSSTAIPEQTRTIEECWGKTRQEIVRLACIRGNLEKLKEQLDPDSKYDIDRFFPASGENPENPLISACLHANYEVVKYLLTEKSANPNAKHPAAKITPIIALAGSTVNKEDDIFVNCATELINARANVNVQNKYGLTALMLATTNQRYPLAKFLLENGADPNLTEPDGKTALFFAVTLGDGRMCRRLLEHGADINMEDRHGMSVPELAQDKNFPELANLLFLVRKTKWRPGLHPKLMAEFDEEALAERKARSEESVMEESSISLMLDAVEGGKYLKNFRKHKISYVQLLTLDDDQLKEIGVDEVGVREKLLDNIKRINNAQWQSSSIRTIATNKNVTAAEAVCMVVNMREHLEHMTSSLQYLNKRIKQDPKALQYDLERNRLEDLMKFCEQTETRSRQFRQTILELHKNIGEVQGYNELQIVGRIPKRSFHVQEKVLRKSTFKWTLGENLFKYVGLLSIAVLIGVKYFKRPSIVN